MKNRSLFIGDKNGPSSVKGSLEIVHPPPKGEGVYSYQRLWTQMPATESQISVWIGAGTL